MKRSLLFMIACVCAVTAAWADETSGTFGSGDTKSTWSLSDNVLTLTFNNANDMPTKTENWATSALCDLTSVTKVVVTTPSGISLSGGDGSVLSNLNDYYRSVPVLDLSTASVNISTITTWANNTQVTISTLAMADGNNNTFNNVIVPSAYSNSLADFKIGNKWNPSSLATLNKYSVSGTTVNAVLDNTSGLTALTNISSTATKLKPAADIAGAIDLSSVLVTDQILDLTNVTTESTGSNAITVASGVKVVCLSAGVKSRISGTDDANITVANPVIKCTATELDDKLTALSNAGVAPDSITITSSNTVLSSTQMGAFGNLTGLKYLSLQEDAGTNLSSLALSSTLQALTLPKSATPESSVTSAMKISSLMYVYAPYSGTQDANQTVADYVWVNQPGGLWQAMENESRLNSAVYVKIACDVAGGVQLNEDDGKFGNHTITQQTSYTTDGSDYPWQYVDLSGTFFGVAATNASTAPHHKGYRIILPDNLTGDHMAIFASKPEVDDANDNPDRGYRGKVAAVYSYNGTMLNLMEITDASYHTDALADSRIVRSGTTEVKVISGSYGGTTYSKFGTNLLAALNAADDTPNDDTTNHITSATVAVGDGFYTNNGTTDTKVTSSAQTYAFSNPHLTSLTLNYINNEYVTIDVSGCTALQTLLMNEAKVAALTAYNSSTPLTSLTTVSLGHTIVGGDVNLQGTSLTTDLEVDLAEITGTLNVSSTSATTYDFTKLTAKKVDASETTSLTNLNINGISLNNGSWTSGDNNEDGKVKVTRTGSNYTNLNITKADSLDAARIIPSSSAGYSLSSIAPSYVEITAAGSSLSTTVPEALTTYNSSQNPVETNTVGNIEILHVTGTLTSEDLNYIKEYLTGLSLLDLSGCTYASGVSVDDLTTASNNKTISKTTAIVLPGKPATDTYAAADTASVYKLQSAGYQCVAYYTKYIRDDETSTYDSRLSVYGYNGTVGNLDSKAPAIIDSNTGITFLPVYSDANGTFGSYPTANPSLLTALGDLPPFSIDMTWLNISNLGTDFSGLSNYTHYLVIPQNTYAPTTTTNGIVYNNDFTDETSTGVTNYKYNSNIYAVSTYKGTASPYAQYAYFGGDTYQFGDGYGQTNHTANLTYVRKEGKFGYCYDYMSDLLKNADILSIAGELNSEDLVQSEYTTSLSDATNPYLDLTHATFATTGDDPVKSTSWDNYSNSNVQSIAMPYGYSTTLAGLPTLGTCESLLGIGCLVKKTDVISGSASKKSGIVYQAQKEGGMDELITMLNALNLRERAYHITSLTVGGPVCAKDLSVQNSGIDENGHLMTSVDASNNMTVSGNGTSGSLIGYAAVIDTFDLSKVTLPYYITHSNKDYCFNNFTRTYANTSNDGEVEKGYSYQNDLCFSKLGITSDQFIDVSYVLPTDTTVWRLPTDALNNVHGLQELCLTYNYQYIGNGAFLDTYLTHITTTDAAGNLVDNGDHTYTLSANLKEIGDNPGKGKSLSESQTVFPQNREVYDVYPLATTVPKCYANAFAANVLYGWGGFKGSGYPYCRDKYINGSNWFCVLRYPYQGTMSDADYLDMEKLYTDIYKIYTKKEQTGAVDANNNPIFWPTFSELRRVEAQALAGDVWYDWDTAYDGQEEVNISSSYDGSTFTKANITVPSNYDYSFDDYKGWHQFVLTQATYVESVEENAVERVYKEGGWYTFCIPFDMNEEQVYEMLGVPYSTAQYTNKVGSKEGDAIKKSGDAEGVDRILPDIRTLKEVTRKPGNTNLIQFRMTDNLAATAGTYKYWKTDTVLENNTLISALDNCGTDSTGAKIVIKGGYPYYIKPYLLDGTTVKNLGKYVMSRYGDKFKKTASCSNVRATMEYLGKKSKSEPSTWEATLKFAKPYEEHKIWAAYDDNDNTTPAYEYHSFTDETTNVKYIYTFIGQFWDQPLPRYCYYTLEGTGKWYRLSSEKNYTWNAYKCVILCTQQVDDTTDHPTSGKFRNNDDGHSNYPSPKSDTSDLLDGTLKIEFLDGLDDYVFVTSGSSRQCIFTFDDEVMGVSEQGTATVIDRLDGEDVLPAATGKVYNMNGQQVGSSTEGLAKGLYIVNGKKIIIK